MNLFNINKCLLFSICLTIQATAAAATPILSLEWLVDSSDTVAQLTCSPSSVDGKPNIDLHVEHIAGEQAYSLSELEGIVRVRQYDDHPKLEFLFHYHEYWIPTIGLSKRPTDWLLFLRHSKSKGVRLVYAVNLTHPKQRSRHAPIAANGSVIQSKKEVLQFVRLRQENRQQVHYGDWRDAIDVWDSKKGAERWYDAMTKEDAYLSNDQVRQIVGAHPIALPRSILLSYWDAPETWEQDAEHHISRIIAPATPNHRLTLIAAILKAKHPSKSMIIALLNYPGKDTEELLASIAPKNQSYAMVASHLLYYFRYRKNPGHPNDKKLLGQWLLDGAHEKVHLQFSADHSCTIDVRPTDATARILPELYKPVDGKGYWAIVDDQLWLGRSQIRENGRWRVARREFFRPKKLLRIADSRIDLDGGPVMYRVDGKKQ